MAKKNLQQEDAQLENVSEAISTTSQWIERNSNVITWCLAAVIVVVIGLISLNNYVIRPKALEASNENAKAVAYFMQGEWEKALKGDEAECLGFEEIADSYSSFQQGELAALYAGICHYQLGNYEEAAHFLRKFSADDMVIDPAARMLLGDAYVQMDELDKAAKAFMSAAASKNEIIAPIALKKAGFVYMAQDNRKAAHRVFVEIRDNYPASSEASDADKYIALTE
jgi:TolA-binding protein